VYTRIPLSRTAAVLVVGVVVALVRAMPVPTRPGRGPLYVIEHLEDGLEDWCRLEYRHICSILPPERVLFLRFPEGVDPAGLVPECCALPPGVRSGGLRELAIAAAATTNSGPTAFAAGDARQGVSSGGGPGCGSGAAATMPALPTWSRTCLLDMQAEEALQPEDGSLFDALVFGGILGNIIEHPDGSYGSDDRTAELRELGFVQRRHLGPMQMTTDTAVLVCRMVLEEGRSLAEIPFVDSPEIACGDGARNGGGGPSDCVCMEGFRYVARRGVPEGDWEPTLPEGMRELLMQSADSDILDSL